MKHCNLHFGNAEKTKFVIKITLLDKTLQPITEISFVGYQDNKDWYWIKFIFQIPNTKSTKIKDNDAWTV